MKQKQLGFGLLSIGRSWGVNNSAPPNADQGCAIIEQAYQKGIRFFDTAPAYAASENVLGAALSGPILERDNVTIATKMGEFWENSSGQTSVCHSYDALVRSIDTSFERLGQIDVLQVHKTTTENVESKDVTRALDYAQSLGIKSFGASISDLPTAQQACRSGRFRYLQFPFSSAKKTLIDVFQMLIDADMKAIINRPLAMGALANEKGKEQGVEEAFRYVLQQSYSGVMLTGTGSGVHLEENVLAYARASLQCG